MPSVMHKLSVRPVKYVPCWENMGPNTTCGSVTVEPEEAEGFIVIVGWKRFSDITDPDNIGNVSNKEELKRFENYSANEVVSRGYCNAAYAPKDRYRLLGWESSGDRGLYIVCMP